MVSVTIETKDTRLLNISIKVVRVKVQSVSRTYSVDTYTEHRVCTYVDNSRAVGCLWFSK